MLLYDIGRTGSEVAEGKRSLSHPVSCAIFINDWLRRLVVFSLGSLAGVKAKRLRDFTIGC
jgi:hypothetical protein